ncbi:acyl-CoA thioesterase [Lentzea rhizosphaerae]|uniref:Acyl-CoA thioesterase n=1 Tax=Lentzea rhizosphaerae TaxID=2041025 RepID=A0ABV8C5Z8_9PSEU
MDHSGDETSVPGVVNTTPLAERLGLHRAGGLLTGSPVHGFDQRVFGGHLLGQVVLAAGEHSPAGRAVESLHVYFLRPGRPGVPIGYSIRTIREGRTRTVLAVSAEQAGRELLAGVVSLGPDEPPHDPVSLTAPSVPAPEELPTLAERRSLGLPPEGVRLPPLGDWRTASRPLDVRYVGGSPRCFWFRAEPAPGAGAHLHRAVLAFASDRSLLPVIARDRPMASVDHAMWFHAAPVCGQWYLYVQDCPAAHAGGGLARGTVFDTAGLAIASVAQHGLVL